MHNGLSQLSIICYHSWVWDLPSAEFEERLLEIFTRRWRSNSVAGSVLITRVRFLAMFASDAVFQTVGLEAFWFGHDKGLETGDSVSGLVCA